MFFTFETQHFKILRLLVVMIAAWFFFGCATSLQSSHIDDFESDGYYEPLPSLGKKGYFIKQLAPEVYFFQRGRTTICLLLRQKAWL